MHRQPLSGLEISRDGIEIRCRRAPTAGRAREAVREARDQIQRRPSEAATADAAEAAAEGSAQGDVTVNITPPGRRQDYFTLGDELPTIASCGSRCRSSSRSPTRAACGAGEGRAGHRDGRGRAAQRQVVEARMAAMQAQVEPHFLFNTLASIDHLIETDPKRASVMQKNLIALLRASMPTLRRGQRQRQRA